MSTRLHTSTKATSMTTPSFTTVPPGLLQRRATNLTEPATVPPIVPEVLRSPGQPLDPPTRAFMESRFDHDFSQVRVHTGAWAAESAHAVNALAYTAGRDVVFGTGQYAPGTTKGRRLLAHELTHVAQKAPSISRADDIEGGPSRYQPPAGQRPNPAPETGTQVPLGEEFSEYEPTLRPKKEIKIDIPPPPLPETPKLPTKCPSAAAVRKEIRGSGIAADAEQGMRKTVNLERSRALVREPFELSQGLIEKADKAIRKGFGSLLPSRRSFASPSTISAKSPKEFAEYRIPDDDTARTRIAEVALATNPDILRQLCITKPTDKLFPILVSEVADPLLNRLKIGFVREYERSRIGGETTHEYSGGKWSRHVTMPDAHRHMGHILVHEAMHYYVHDTFFATADCHPLEKQLHEGGAEYLARRVIHEHLSSDPAFKVDSSAYASEFNYVNTHLATRSFPLAYFQGHVGLLGLTPRTTPCPASQTGTGAIQRLSRVRTIAPLTIQPKLAIGQPDDEHGQEATRATDTRVPTREPQNARGIVVTNHTWRQGLQRLCVASGEEIPQQGSGGSPSETVSPLREEGGSGTSQGACCRYRRLYIARQEYRPVTVEGQRNVVKYAKIAFVMERGADPRECVLVNWNKGCKYEIDQQGQVVFGMAVHHLGGFHPWCFPNWSVDSWDADPVFWSHRGPTRWNYTRERGNTYYMEDRPGACSHPRVHAVQFRTCIYCQDNVPTTTDTTGSNIGAPLECVEWEYLTRWRDPNTAEHPSLPDPICGRCAATP